MSLLLNLYKYREREKLNQLENYCTEVLCYCLNKDYKLRTDFLLMIDKNIDCNHTYKITTQNCNRDGTSKPDITIVSDDIILFIECKIDSEEGRQQLSRYADVLINEYENKRKYLVYLTKYDLTKDRLKDKADVIFFPCLWENLCNKISIENDHFSMELKMFIQDTFMKKIKEITKVDIEILKNISNVIEGYDGFLNDYKEKVENRYSNYNLHFINKSNLVRTWIKQDFTNSLAAEISLNKNQCFLWFGIFIKDNNVVAGVEINFPTETEIKFSELRMILLTNSDAEEYDDKYHDISFKGIYFYKDLKAFISADINELINWYNNHFEVIFNSINHVGIKIIPNSDIST